MVCFADDLALVATARTVRVLVGSVNRALEAIEAWLSDRMLELAPHKTEAILLTGRKRMEYLEFKLGNVTIIPQRTMRYLGVFLDRSLTFGEHVKRTVDRAEATANKLCRIMPNIEGARVSKRKPMAAVVNSIILYGAEIWGDAA